MLRWGILGTAKINLTIIPIIAQLKDQKIFAIASRDKDKAEDYAKQHSIVKSYGSYAELIAADEIDAVYISLPNDQHYHWTKLALLAGKHVLCEKPLALNSADLYEIAEIANVQKRILMEGFMYRHHHQIKNLRDLLNADKIGKIHHVHSSFHFTIPAGPNIRLNVANGGGVIWDLGCYLVNLSNYIFSRPPQSVAANAYFDNDIDLIFSGMMNYEDGASASFDCSFAGPRRNHVIIMGTKGNITLDNPFKGSPLSKIIIDSEAESEEIIISDNVNSYARQLENFYAAVQGQAKPLVSLNESIATAKTLESLFQAAKNKIIVCLS